MNQTQNNTKIKCLITDFDETFFRTAIAADLKKTKPIDWDKIYSLIPQFEMYPGWKEVMTWLKENNIKFAVVSQSTRGILSRTFKHFGIEPAYVGCFDLFHRKPHARNLEKALEALAGVASAEVSHKNGTAVVTFTSDVSDDVLRSCVQDKDFTVISIR